MSPARNATASGSTVERLLERYGRTYADELGIPLAGGTPSALFRMLCAAHLASARIGARIAGEAARGLFRAGWTTAERMAASSWDDRVRVLDEARYVRYDYRTATMLGEVAEQLLDRYRGDLRRLRKEAGQDPAQERRLLKQLKGIGEVGADIFLREVQVCWPEVRPFADRRALTAAGRLGLGSSAEDLRRLVPEDQLVVLVAALVRVDLDHGYDELAR